MCPHGLQRTPSSIQLENCDEVFPNLYVGGYESLGDLNQLVKQGIHAVVCCMRATEYDCSSLGEAGIECFHVDVEDMGREPLELFFDDANAFIHSHLARHEPVLVFCRAGVSRSPTIVLAYFISQCNHSAYEAFSLVHSKRSCITPNISFMDKLIALEKTRGFSQPTLDVWRYSSWLSAPVRDVAPDLRRRD